MIIKILLLTGLLAIALLAYRSPLNARNSAIRRLGALSLLVIACLAVLLPGLVTSMAKLVGVGRGTDLVLYVLAVATLFVWLGLYRRIHDLEERVRTLTREVALRDAGVSGDRPSDANDRA